MKFSSAPLASAWIGRSALAINGKQWKDMESLMKRTNSNRIHQNLPLGQEKNKADVLSGEKRLVLPIDGVDVHKIGNY